MNLIAGRLMDDAQSRAALETLDALLLETREKTDLPADAVIRACGALSNALNEREHVELLTALGMSGQKALEELHLVKSMLSREYLESRLKHEFGAGPGSFTPYGEIAPVRQEWAPLGVLLHIAAGNVDALPVFSVIEGLLTGNINLLKLPGQDDGLSVPLLMELIKLEPLIARYVFVFDYPSHDLDAMKKLMRAADAIVVWGGDAAVSAVRSAASPATRIIEWGHKISFAYASGEVSDSDLEGIAYNICDTNQLFCNSCQGIFLDTEDFDEVLRFAERFMEILARTAGASAENDPYVTAQKTLEVYTERLEAANAKKRVFSTNGCSVIAYDDSELTPSYMYKNCWVRPLPQKALLYELCKHKNHLQTVALACDAGRKAAIEALLKKTGAVRVTSGARMSKSYCGAPHDGEFSLRRYMKIMSYEY